MGLSSNEVGLPINENLRDYPYESRYLEIEPNGTRYYLCGKAVVVTESGGLMWYAMPQEDIGYFSFDEMVVSYEGCETAFTPAEETTLRVLRDLDEQARELGLHVVTLQASGDGRQFAVFYCPESEAYFSVDLDEIDWVNAATADAAGLLEPSLLSAPYHLRVGEDGNPA